MRRVALVIILGSVAAPAALGAGPSKLSPPVVHEHFTPLPCAGRSGHRTTLQQEGCAERRILAGDATINRLARSIFYLLRDDSARRRFIAAQHGWLAFRRADCLSVADQFEGGSQAPVVFAQCTAARNLERIRNLRTFHHDLGRTG